MPAASWRLPHDLGRCGLLAELSPGQLAAAIAEALHAGTPGGARTDRAIDVRVLRELTGVLAGRGVTPQRLAAAIRAALGQRIPGGILSPGEQDLLAGDLFPAGYRQQIGASLLRSDAVLAELAACASDGWPAQPARCTCLALDGGPRTAAGEVLAALIVQWLTVQVTSAANPPAVIIAGADDITRGHLERLTDACELRGTPVTVLFRHLRGDAASLLGGGTAAFMRLGNHTEAEQAAAYLGRRHTFVVSSFTATRGGSAVECDPAIITLPGASTAPLPPPGTLAQGGMPPGIMNNANLAGPVIAPPGQDATAWLEPPAEEPQPTWPPDEHQPDVPWWQRNEPPDQQP